MHPSKYGTFVELVSVILIGGDQRIEKRVVLLARHRAVEIRSVVTGALHRLLAVPRPSEDEGVVDRISGDDRRDRVVKRQGANSQTPADGLGQLLRGERTGGDHTGSRDARDLFAHYADSVVGRDARCHRGRKDIAIHCQRAASGDSRAVGCIEDQRAEEPHLGLEQAVSVGELRALERVRANELGESVGLVRRRRHDRTHLVQRYLEPAGGELPRCLRAGEAPADNRDSLRHTATASGVGATSHSFAHLMQRR